MKKNISKVHLNLLKKPARSIFLELVQITPDGILGGGTAIMLFLAHRRSFDFDVFFEKPVAKNLLVKLKDYYQDSLKSVIVDTADELSVIVFPETKLSFIYFPFEPLHKTIDTESIPLFSLEDLASNKAYVIGRRGAWRDYVDLFSLLKNGIRFEKVILEAKARFGGAFSEKLFCEQLTYFGDLADFTVEFIGKVNKDKEIQKYFEDLVKGYLRKVL